MAGKIIQRPELAGGFTTAGVEIVDANGNIKAPISTTNATFSGNTTLGDNSADTTTLNALMTVTTNQKIQFRDTGIFINSGADGKLTISADGSGADDITLSGSVTTSDVVTLGGKLNLYAIGSAAASASGLLMGVGTSANPAATASAGSIFAEFRTKSTATSGDSRGLYWRHEIGGAGGGGESLRSFSKVTAAASTVRGAHISLDLDAAGSVSGFGAGVDAQVMLGATAYSSTLASVNLEIYANAGATITGATSMLRGVIQGDPTAVANVNANAFFLDLSSVTAGSAGFIDTDVTALTGYGSIKVKCPDGVTRFIPITTGS